MQPRSGRRSTYCKENGGTRIRKVACGCLISTLFRSTRSIARFSAGDGNPHCTVAKVCRAQAGSNSMTGTGAGWLTDGEVW
jgi:hypothetical protein